MFLEQFHEPRLGHASYLVGSDVAGTALVVDPRRDVDVYLRSAAERGVRISHVLDTHGHNDYLSGLAELADRTGAEVLASAHGEVGYDHRPVKDGETIEVGDAILEVLHTPGHTPEHVALLVSDGSADESEPALLLSGGSLLVGDVARPDLLGSSEEAAESARTLCRTLEERILTLPGHVEVFPTHVAGSLCAGGIGSRLSTTIGFERATNPALRRLAAGEAGDGCVDLEDLPAVPPYWRRMRPRNLAGAPALGPVDPPSALTAPELEERITAGAVVLDTRDYAAFGAGHVPRSLNVGLDGSFPTWAGTVLPEDAEILLVLDRPGDLMEATWHLLRVGYERPAGWLAGGIDAWRTSDLPVEIRPPMPVRSVADRPDDLAILDVRQPDEWKASRIPGAVWITGAEVPGRLDEVPEGPVAVVCGTGYRSGVVASLLAREGWSEAANMLGGMSAWTAAGLPTTTD